jgi:hypothetical protein
MKVNIRCVIDFSIIVFLQMILYIFSPFCTCIYSDLGYMNTSLRDCLDPLSFYKNWFLLIAHKNSFLKKTEWGCLETVSKNCKSIFIE